MMLPEMQFNEDGMGFCQKHHQQYPTWDDCPKCEQEWLDDHDSRRALNRMAKIAVLVACIVGLMTFPLMAIFASK